jgi:hypothetical protein
MILGGGDRLGQLLRFPVGERTDRLLYLLLEPWFLGYWTFSRPTDKGVELADVLTWYADVALLFEAKTRETGASDLDWARRRIKEAIEQLNDRAGRLKRGEVGTLRNAWRGEVQWNPDTTRTRDYYGVVIMNHLSEPYDPRELAPEAFRDSAIPIQVFSLADFMELLRFVNTIFDFIVYYEMRDAYSRSYRLHVHRESDTYFSVLALMPELAPPHVSRADLRDMQRRVASLSRAIARPADVREADDDRLAASYLIDTALNSVVQRATQDDSGKRVGGETHDFTVRGMSALAEMSRLRRAVWGQRWVDAARVAQQTRTTRHINGRSPSRNRGYLVSAAYEDRKAREVLMGERGRGLLHTDGLDSVLCLAANPMRILWTFDAYRRAIRGRGYELADDRVLDTTMGFIERK